MANLVVGSSLLHHFHSVLKHALSYLVRVIPSLSGRLFESAAPLGLELVKMLAGKGC